jgi:hypothetical protein
MRSLLALLLVAAIAVFGSAEEADIYGMQVTTIEGQRISLEAFKHKPSKRREAAPLHSV